MGEFRSETTEEHRRISSASSFPVVVLYAVVPVMHIRKVHCSPLEKLAVRFGSFHAGNELFERA